MFLTIIFFTNIFIYQKLFFCERIIIYEHCDKSKSNQLENSKTKHKIENQRINQTTKQNGRMVKTIFQIRRAHVILNVLKCCHYTHERERSLNEKIWYEHI